MYNIFYLVDVRRTLKIEDLSFIKKLIKYSNNYLLILTKVDKIPKYQRIPILKKFSKKLNIEENNIILCSAIQHIGFYKIIEYLWKIILQQ